MIFFGTEYAPQEILNKIKNKYISQNIFKIQDDDYIMCGSYCIAFMKYMILGKNLLDYTNLPSPNDNKNNNEIICKYCKDKYDKKRKSFFRPKKINIARRHLLDENNIMI